MVHENTAYAVTDIPLTRLGTLEASAHPSIQEGEVTINGISLPNHVIEELRELGIPLNWYNSSQLRHIVQACHYDRNLIDDPNGTHLFDQMHLDPHEAAADEHAAGLGMHPRLSRSRHIHRHRFCEHIEEERAAQKADSAYWLSN